MQERYMKPHEYERGYSMKLKKFKVLLLVSISTFFLITLIYAGYVITNIYNIDSQFFSGLFGAVIGGMFSLLSVWTANEIQDIRKGYNELPAKIRRISKLRDKIWEIKGLLGQNDYQVHEKIEDLLDIGSLIDGATYSKCINLRDKLLEYHHKNL